MGRRKMPPATSPEEREDQLISLAYDLAEKRLLDGTATAQEVTTFIKAGSRRERLERARIENENLLLSAKVDAMEGAKRVESLVGDAIKAFKRYSGATDEDEEEDYGDVYAQY